MDLTAGDKHSHVANWLNSIGNKECVIDTMNYDLPIVI
jgi:hypothetical protein